MQGMRLLNCTLQSGAGPAAAVAIAAVDPIIMHHNITANFTASIAAPPRAISLALDENSTLTKTKLKTADGEEEKTFSYQNSKTQLRSVVSFWSSRKEKKKEMQSWSARLEPGENRLERSSYDPAETLLDEINELAADLFSSSN